MKYGNKNFNVKYGKIIFYGFNFICNKSIAINPDFEMDDLITGKISG